MKAQDFLNRNIEPIAYFGHLLGASFDVKPTAELLARAMTPSATSPSLLVQVYRVTSAGRNILAGYGYAHLPDTAGANDVDIKTWKPVGNTQTKLKVRHPRFLPYAAFHMPAHNTITCDMN